MTETQLHIQMEHFPIPEDLTAYFPEVYAGEELSHYLQRFFEYNDAVSTWIHCQEVGRQARKLAEQYGLDVQTALLAGWLHDISTVLTDEQKTAFAQQYHIPILEAENKVPYLLHQKLSAYWIHHVMHIHNTELINAVSCHTTLKGNMAEMDKLLFIADKLSWETEHAAPYIKQMRIAAEFSLDEAVDVYLDYLWNQYESGQMRVLHPWLIEARYSLSIHGYYRSLSALSAPIQWGPVTARFQPVVNQEQMDMRLVSNVSIVPMLGDQVIMIQLEDGRWELPGGTLEAGEYYLDGLRREVREELGGELLDYQLFGCFHCESSAAAPYREYIPHPHFIRLTGYGQVRLDGLPLNPPDGEQVTTVDIVSIEEAVTRFEHTGRSDLADFYRMGYYCWQQNSNHGTQS